MRLPTPKLSILIVLILLFCQSFAQKVGFQFYQGVNKPLVSFTGDQGSLDYTTDFNSDTRIGVGFGDSNKITSSVLFGASSIRSVARNEDIVTSFTSSSLRIDALVRYSFPKSFISSVAAGPSVGILMSSSQDINGLPVRSDELFSSTNFYLGGEIDFWGYSGEGVHLHPYISYRMMLSNADLDADDLKINELSFGLRINISK